MLFLAMVWKYKYFLQFCRLSLHFVYCFLLCRRFLIGYSFTYLILFLLLVSYPKHCSYGQCQGAFSLDFSSKSFIVSGLTYTIHFKLTFVLKERGLFSFFCMWISTFPNTIYWRDYIFSPWSSFGSPLNISWLHIYCWDPNFLLFVHLSVFMQYCTIFIAIAL